MPVDCEIATLSRLTARLFAPMTFPAYRRLVLRAGDPEGPIACGAIESDRPIGLALVEDVPGLGPTLRSLYVQPDRRGQGVATRLLARAEEAALASGWDALRTVYTAGGAGIDAFERVLAKGGWEPPVRRTWVMRSTPEGLTQAFARVHLRPLDAATEIFPWRRPTDVSGSKRGP
jgi:GNAT superfamily N-acetyltransferase